MGDYPAFVGSQGKPLLQRATTYDLLVALRNAGVEFDLSTLATQTTLASVLAQLDSKTSVLALETGGNLAAILAKLDVALSTRALEAGGNLAAILAKLDVALSTRALEAGGNLASIVTLLAGGLPAALDGTSLKIKEQSPLTTIGVTPSTGISEYADITPNGSATRFTASSVAIKGMIIRALVTNSGVGRVGDSSADATHGAELSGGDSIPISIDNVNKVYVYAAAGSDKFSMSYVT